MMKLEVIGNLGADAIVKQIGEKNYLSFSVATTEKHRDSTGNQSSTTTWISALWNTESGQEMLKYLKTGTKVFIRGNLRMELYDDRNGQKQLGISVFVRELELCGSRDQGKTDNV